MIEPETILASDEQQTNDATQQHNQHQYQQQELLVSSDNNNITARRNDCPRNWAKSPFSINKGINSRVELITNLDKIIADAVVNPTNETFSKLHQIVDSAGKELVTHLQQKVKLCPTGDVRLTSGFKSGFKHIIHAVPPKYQAKYKTAAESALFHTYFKILELAIEHKIKSLVMLPLVTAKSNLPGESNSNMHLRIVRRLLEKKVASNIEKVLIYVTDCELLEHYRYYYSAYFPSSHQDEEDACYKLQSCIGGQNGEPVIPGREIRIVPKPVCFDRSVDLTSGLDLSVAVGRTAFGKMVSEAEINNKRQNSGAKSVKKSPTINNKFVVDANQRHKYLKSQQALVKQSPRTQIRNKLTSCSVF